MRTLAITIVAGLMVPMLSLADDGGKLEVGRDIGSVLAWRLGPEVAEEACRSVDPEGTESRSKSLSAWREKNAALIKEVDARVAEVAPLAYPAPANVDAAEAVRSQVKKILRDLLFSGGTPEQSLDVCKAVADPANPKWANNGMPQVQQSLAELYDWKVQRTGK